MSHYHNSAITIIPNAALFDMVMNLQAYYNAYRSAAVLDASSLGGRIEARGVDVLDLLHRMSTNDVRPLFGTTNVGTQTVLTNEKGRIVDVLTVLSEAAGALLLTSGGAEEKVIAWLDKFVIMEDAKFINATNRISHFIVFGPKALELLSELSGANLSRLEYYSAVDTTIGGHSVRIQKSDRIVESGFSVFIKSDDASAVLATLGETITTNGGAVLDGETFETIRIEAGIPTSPNELNERHNPLETSLVKAVSFTKGCYIGQEVIARLDSYDKVQRHLMGIRFGATLDTVVPGSAVALSDSTEIGELTSVTTSPTFGATIALGFVKTAYANPGATVYVASHQATLEKLPFELDD